MWLNPSQNLAEVKSRESYRRAENFRDLAVLINEFRLQATTDSPMLRTFDFPLF
jgi:hypothetical protein